MHPLGFKSISLVYLSDNKYFVDTLNEVLQILNNEKGDFIICNSAHRQIIPKTYKHLEDAISDIYRIYGKPHVCKVKGHVYKTLKD